MKGAKKIRNIREQKRKSEEKYEPHIELKGDRNKEMKCENRKEGETNRKERMTLRQSNDGNRGLHYNKYIVIDKIRKPRNGANVQIL